jgi:catechol 2,3-dioxygenase
MNPQAHPGAPADFSIHPATLMGPVSLAVASLAQQIQFYQTALGFQLHWRTAQQAALGAGGADLLQLSEAPNLKRYRGTTGLYHFAVLFPNRRELARALVRLHALQYRNHPTDHIMTKATYLDDPEGNGIELYCESPEDGRFTIEDNDFVTRRTDGTLSDGREPLDVAALLRHLQADDNPGAPLPPETRVGHVHLHVRNVAAAVDFYHGILGFDVMGHSATFQAAFVSAGGYHHHLGLNAWKGAAAPLPPAGAVGLQRFTIDLPNQPALDEVAKRIAAAGIASQLLPEGLLVHDPCENGVLLRSV